MILQSIKKEFILVFSDLHSVAVLLLMPIIFMLIMTFAMSERQADVIEKLAIQVTNTGELEQELYSKYLAGFGYQVSTNKEDASAKLVLQHNFSQGLFSKQSSSLVEVEFSRKTSPAIKAMLNQHIQLAFARVKLHLYLLENGDLDDSLPVDKQIDEINRQTETAHYIALKQDQDKLPIMASSIPSWLIFGVYFIVLPIATTLLNEIKNGTLIRLKTFPINLNNYFLVKLGAFYVFSLAQFFILNIVGWHLIPPLLSYPIVTIAEPATLALCAIVISLAAVSFAAIIATVVQSFEQAIVLGGGINIIMAALSGFMVPLDIMPTSLQHVAQFSPMYWSAELVKGAVFGGFQLNHLKMMTYLCLFIVISLAVSALLFRVRIRKLTWN
ncbi:ABC transporter permease [Paraglaciecola hydrolytica]|uniref:ABC-2 type transporter transmembrane domain-containing protein n=1 Tax=Paraglaciecola hydrolytica TaxID=1799789 RepID=A0A136A232_9ALTE|nr:ABC transporter permease [Paraglaciecola hydrolytica]KXI29308.1 hypothetical protein AX660_14295 [Paraglaciecola hydrolytica]